MSEKPTTPPPPPEPIFTLRAYAEEISDINFTTVSSKDTLVCGSTSGYLGLWDLSSKRQKWHETCSSPVVSVKTLQTDSRLLSQCRNSVVDLWDLEKQSKSSSMVIDKAGFCKLSVLQTTTEDVYQPSFFNAHCFAVANSEYGKVNIYDSLSKQLLSTLSAESPDKKGMCMCVAVHCDKSNGHVNVLGGFEDGSIILWDTRHNKLEVSSLKLFTEPVMCMTVDSQRECLFVGSATTTVEKVSFSDQTFQKGFTVDLKNVGVASVAVRNDGKIFSTGGWDGRIRVFGCKKGKGLAALNYHSETINTLTFAHPGASPSNSSLLLCGSKDGRISMWKIY